MAKIDGTIQVIVCESSVVHTPILQESPYKLLAQNEICKLKMQTTLIK